MNRFTYYAADTVENALRRVNSSEKGKFIAGGTNLLDLMKENVIRPQELINISKLPQSGIEQTPSGGLLLAALCSNAETAYHPLVEQHYPLLSSAILAGASAQLRNMATNGGNLMQRTRCYYFYDTATPCNKRQPGSGCSAINGYNRIHAILGASEHCIAVHPSDMCVALAALDAVVHVKSTDGERSLRFADFHRLPGDTPEKDNTLLANELITGIELPQPKFTKFFKYLKVRDRSSYAFALISVAAAFDIEDGKIKEARVALGGVAHKPWRNLEAESFLQGKEAVEQNFNDAAELILADAKGYGTNNFKPALAKRAIIRACKEAAEGGVSL